MPIPCSNYPTQLYSQLPTLAVPTLVIFGSESPWNTPDLKDYWARKTSTNKAFQRRGPERKVELVTLEGLGHLIPLEAPKRCAEMVAGWVRETLPWWEGELEREQKWKDLGRDEREELIDDWARSLKSKI